MNERHELTYFTDRDLGHLFPRLLRDAGLKVERHDDHFGPRTSDDEWLPIVARHGWVAVTRDGRIRYSPMALQVLMESGARLFVVVGKLSSSESAELFLRWKGGIEDLAREHKRALIAKVRKDGVHEWLTHSQWSERRR